MILYKNFFLKKFKYSFKKIKFLFYTFFFQANFVHKSKTSYFLGADRDMAKSLILAKFSSPLFVFNASITSSRLKPNFTKFCTDGSVTLAGSSIS